jgi:hypothetical protein
VLSGRALPENDFLVEGQPVVKIVQVDGIEDLAFVLDVAGAEDRLAGCLAVVIAGNGGVEFINGGLVESAAFFLENPGFQFGIGWFFIGNEFLELIFIDAEAIEHHLVEAGADGGIVVMEFPGGAEGDFLPEARKMENAQWTGNAGADHRNKFAHGNQVMELGLVARAGSRRPGLVSDVVGNVPCVY